MFWDGFLQWLASLTFWDFLLIFWLFIIIDLARSVGKPLLLIIHDLTSKHTPKNEQVIFKPKVSIIIPAHNEEAAIVKSIESALNTDYPNKEVIVVDDGSKDKTYMLASIFASNGQIKLVHRDYSSGSKAGALNYGIIFASGDVLVTVDADTLIEPDSLGKLVNNLGDPEVSAASGNVRILCGDSGKRNLLVRFQEYEYFLAFELGRRFSSKMGTMMIISGAFGAFRSADFRSLGQYDKDTITEDFDLTIKLRKLRKKIVYNNQAVSWTFAPDNWRSWRKQRIRWTKGEAETLWKHRNVFGRKGFDYKSVVSIYDMLFSDVILLALRILWFVSLLFIFPNSILYVLFLSLLMYMLLELFSTGLTVLISRDKSNFKYLLLVPFMVLFYRPWYSFVRLRAYFDWVFKKKTNW
jgi:cellulose synthase/poly-beta-1,6-N-acetylglucosamine synthase-like glycosyltransferase